MLYISVTGVSPDPVKTEVVSSYSAPTDAKQLRQFLGLANFYCHFYTQLFKNSRISTQARKGNAYT